MDKDKPLVSCSLGEFFDSAVEKFAQLMSSEEEAPVKRRLVYGLAGLSQLLGCSISTAARIKKSGVLAPAIHQTGKIIIVDADLALEIMQMKSRKRR